jgi:hypothetical protein
MQAEEYSWCVSRGIDRPKEGGERFLCVFVAGYARGRDACKQEEAEEDRPKTI